MWAWRLVVALGWGVGGGCGRVWRLVVALGREEGRRGAGVEEGR